MPDNRFKDFPIDNRFPGGGVDVRFATPGLDLEQLLDGTDTRFEGLAYGGAPPAGAFLSGLAYAADLISVTTDTASGTIYYLLHNSVTPLAAADIKADVLDLSAVGGGTLDPLDTDNIPVDWTAVTPGTYWINMVQDTGVFSNVVFLEVTIVAAAFDPASLPGAEVVIDVSDMTTLWQDTAGATQVTASGQTVGSVTNRGNKGGLFVNTGGADEPLYTEASGRKYLTFAAANSEYLRLDLGGGAAFSQSGGFWLWVLFNDTTSGLAAPSRALLSITSPSTNQVNNNNGFAFLNTDFGSDTCAVRIEAGPTNSSGVQAGNMEDRRTNNMAWGIAEFEAIPTASAPNLWLRVEKSADGGTPVQIATLGTTGAGGYPDSSTNAKWFTIGANMNGGAGALNAFTNCDIAAVVMVAGALSTTDRDNVRAWLRTRGAF